MKTWLTIVVAAVSLCTGGCGRETQGEHPKSVTFRIHNPIPVYRADEALILDVHAIRRKAPDFSPRACLALWEGKEVPSQANDLNGDGEADQLVVLLDIPPKSTKEIVLKYSPGQVTQRSYTKRTHAELSVKTGGAFVGRKYVGGQWVSVRALRVPKEHTDHSEFIRFEGPGWESDRVGYRFYLDWRNAIDVFGKKVPAIVLQDVGLDGFESYHGMADWGMDILKVGESLGIGSVGMWVDGKAHRVSVVDSVQCDVVLDGPVQSLVRSTYWGWRIGDYTCDLVSELSITAGSRITTHRLQVRGNVPNLCTGIVKDLAAKSFTYMGGGRYGYLATYGKQSLAGDSLGLAVFFRQRDLVTFAEDEYSHVVVLRPQGGEVTYHFLAAWEQEPGGIKTRAEFVAYLEEVLERLDHPMVAK